MIRDGLPSTETVFAIPQLSISRKGQQRQPGAGVALRARATRRHDEGVTPQCRDRWPRQAGYSPGSLAGINSWPGPCVGFCAWKGIRPTNAAPLPPPPSKPQHARLHQALLVAFAADEQVAVGEEGEALANSPSPRIKWNALAGWSLVRCAWNRIRPAMINPFLFAITSANRTWRMRRPTGRGWRPDANRAKDESR